MRRLHRQCGLKEGLGFEHGLAFAAVEAGEDFQIVPPVRRRVGVALYPEVGVLLAWDDMLLVYQ